MPIPFVCNDPTACWRCGTSLRWARSLPMFVMSSMSTLDVVMSSCCVGCIRKPLRLAELGQTPYAHSECTCFGVGTNNTSEQHAMRTSATHYTQAHTALLHMIMHTWLRTLGWWMAGWLVVFAQSITISHVHGLNMYEMNAICELLLKNRSRIIWLADPMWTQRKYSVWVYFVGMAVCRSTDPPSIEEHPCNLCHTFESLQLRCLMWYRAAGNGIIYTFHGPQQCRQKDMDIVNQ